MPLNIITADQRLATPAKINIAVFGPSGVGKTTQARTLDPARTLFLDGEAGTLALGDWRGATVDMRKEASRLGLHPWQLAVGLACWLGGPDPADANGEYSAGMYASYCQALGDPAQLVGQIDTVFVDSITVIGRWSFDWAKRQPEAFSERTGKPDTRGAYGLHGRQMVRWLTALQHVPEKSIIVVGILNRDEDDLKRVVWTPQIDGAKTSNELPGIFDTVLTLNNFTTADGQQYRAFCCHQQNPWNFPAKDRSGKLDMLEPPNLGQLIAKMRSGPRVDGSIVTTLPPPPPPPVVGNPVPAA